MNEGRDPMGIHRDANAVLRSRTQNTFVKVPAAATPDEEIALLKKVGRDVSDGDELHRFPPV